MVIRIKRKYQFNREPEVLYGKSNNITLVMCVDLTCLSVIFSNGNWFRTYSNHSILIESVLFLLCLFAINIGRFSIRECFPLIALLLYCVVDVYINRGGLGSVFQSCFGMMWCMVLQKCKFSRKSYTYVVLSFLFIFVAMINTSSREMVDLYFMGNLMINPNTIGFFIVISSGILLIYLDDFSLLGKITKIIIIVFSSVMIFWTESRAALLMYAFFIILKYIVPYKIKKKSFFMTIFGIVFVAGIVFPIVYVGLFLGGLGKLSFLSDFSQRVFHKAVFTGRDAIWIDLLNLLDSDARNWVLGVGSNQVLLRYGYEINPHNMYMTMLVNFGLVGIALYFWFYVEQIRKIFGDTSGKISTRQIDLISLCISYFVLGIFETTPIWIPFAFITGFLWALPYCLRKKDAR